MSKAIDESSREAATSTVGLERWRFKYTIDNFGPEKLESGKKRCENDGCSCAADMIVEGQSAIFFACTQCAHLIPGANVLRYNVELTGSGQVHRPESSDRSERGLAPC